MKVQPILRSGIEKGTPDVLGCYQGVMVLAETKLPGAPIEDLQLVRIREWRAAGAVADIVESVEHFGRMLDMVDNILAFHGFVAQISVGAKFPKSAYHYRGYNA